MRMMRLAFLAALLAAPAFAQSVDDLPDRPIARSEVLAVIKRQFAAIDANHDGVVTRAEFDAFRARQAAGKVNDAALGPFGHVGGHWFEHADPNGTGRVRLADAAARPLKLFDLADLNHDGVIDQRERQMAQMLMGLQGK